MITAFEKETTQLQDQLKSDQDSVLKQLTADFEKEKELIEQELREGLSELRNQMNVIKTKAEEAALNLKNQSSIQDMATPSPPAPSLVLAEKESAVQLSVVNSKSSLEPEYKNDELKSLSFKYDQLEKKYKYLKKELRKLTSRESHTSNKQSPEEQTVFHNKNFPSSKSEPLSLASLGSIQKRNNLPQRDVEESIPSSDNGASDSPSESTTLYPSSSVNHQPNSDIEPELEPKSSNKDNHDHNGDKLTMALKSLELLKTQILTMKQEAEIDSYSKAPKQSPKKNSQNNRPDFQPKKKSSSNQLISPTQLAKKSAQSLARIGGLRGSRSTSELPGLIEDSHEELSHEIVKEAKEFIRSQKERLNSSTLPPSPRLKFDRPISTTWTNPNSGKKGYIRYSLDEISYPPSIPRSGGAGNYSSLKRSPNIKNTLVDLYSETESSGIGSLKDLESQEKKQISKDIETICSSLSNLDHQMKLMWSVVQGGSGGGNQGPVIDSSSKSNLNALLSSQRSKGFVSPVRSLPSRPMISVDSIGGLSPSNRALLESLKAATLPTSRVSNATNLLNSLDKELKDFKAAKERILHQFSGSAEELNNGILPTSSESIQEKTKDLREWLEKF
jgi:hypothetical protein